MKCITCKTGVAEPSGEQCQDCLDQDESEYYGKMYFDEVGCHACNDVAVPGFDLCQKHLISMDF